MSNGAANPRADFFFARQDRWREELEFLRSIALESGLTEEFKWGKPCYTFCGNNVAILFSFRESCAVGFLKGALLRDERKLLVSPGEHSQAMRMLKFTGTNEIRSAERDLKDYFAEAAEMEKAGLDVPFRERAEAILPDEFIRKMDEDPPLKAAFEALTPGRRRAYAIFFSQPKQSATRVSRIEKAASRILAGKGPNDR